MRTFPWSRRMYLDADMHSVIVAVSERYDHSVYLPQIFESFPCEEYPSTDFRAGLIDQV